MHELIYFSKASIDLPSRKIIIHNFVYVKMLYLLIINNWNEFLKIPNAKLQCNYTKTFDKQSPWFQKVMFNQLLYWLNKVW